MVMIYDSDSVFRPVQDPPRKEGGLLSSVIHKLEQQFVVCSLIASVTMSESLQGVLRW